MILFLVMRKEHWLSLLIWASLQLPISICSLLTVKKTRRLSILLHEWRIWEYITKRHVNIKDSTKLLQTLVSLNFRH